MTVKWVGFAAIAVAVVTSGCVTGPRFHEMAPSMPTLRAGEGRIVFLRGKGAYFGGGIRPDIRLDNEVVGESLPGGFFYVDRKAGDHVAALTTEVEEVFPFNLKAGETRYLRTYAGVGVVVWRIHFAETSAEKAKVALAGLVYTGNPGAGDVAMSAVSPKPMPAPGAVATPSTVPTQVPIAIVPSALAVTAAPGVASSRPLPATVAPVSGSPQTTLEDLRYVLPTR